ncbi:hypothetical protein FDP41_001040 [Naegleria fowleri]|uniref:Uncharacterized protein n=1 Tax=Naegleria fowleri TaxID=5763 RepID=A0A6A5BRS5_NAEFO|nr:uncharacterized protein FDP41_001040 [Naegleria fowleri]KAF0979887.1 hypothetical protein FDP41_001040 [Naegleria fowleri]
MFCLVFWARFYCLENNVAGLFDGFINENDDADEDEINQRIYKNCAMAAFGFIKLHFFMMNFAVSFINNAAAHSKTGAFPNPFQKENNATIASSPISFNFNLLFHAAVVVLYVYIVFIFVWSVVGIKYAFLIGAVHVAIIIALYRNTIKYVLSLASGTSSTPQQASQASSEGENKKND